MDWSFAFFANSVLLGVGLAMDAFSVSTANALNEPDMPRAKGFAIAGTFSFFQALMPMTGWICVHTIVSLFNSLQVFIPWIGFLLLLFLGGKMLFEGLRASGSDEEEKLGVGFGGLLLQGVATSIDALSVGFTIEQYDWRQALVASLIIAAVTFFICLGGLAVGRRFGTKLSGKASVLGGAILILIGFEILVKGVFA